MQILWILFKMGVIFLIITAIVFVSPFVIAITLGLLHNEGKYYEDTIKYEREHVEYDQGVEIVKPRVINERNEVEDIRNNPKLPTYKPNKGDILTKGEIQN